MPCVRSCHETRFPGGASSRSCAQQLRFPYLFPKSWIPLVILNSLDGQAAAGHGDGLNIPTGVCRVLHGRALVLVLTRGRAARNTMWEGERTDEISQVP